jgi:hypothetical protein
MRGSDQSESISTGAGNAAVAMAPIRVSNSIAKSVCFMGLRSMKANVTVMSPVEIGGAVPARSAVPAPGLSQVEGSDRRFVLRVLQVENARLRDQVVNLSLEIQELREKPSLAEKTIGNLFALDSYQRRSGPKRSS